MKLKQYYFVKNLQSTFNILGLFLITTFGLWIGACSEDEQPVPMIASLEPSHAPIGATIVIKGNGFDLNTVNNAVEFFDGAEAQIISATSTALEVVVPPNALTGKITVTIGQRSASSDVDFIITPTVSDFTPKSAITGSSITITGTGFSTTKENNLVTFNQVAATVLQATSTSLVVTVPEAGSTGKIRVQVGSEIATSMEDFIFLPSVQSLSPIVGAVNRVVTIKGSGFNVIPTSNLVSLNGLQVTVLTSSVNQITFAVPPTATTGAVVVTSGGYTATGPAFKVVVEAMKAGGSEFEYGNSVATDISGNTFVTGSFKGTMTIGNITLVSDSEDIFVARYDRNAELQWAKKIGGSESDRGISIAVDNFGNCYVSGWYNTHSAFVAKLDDTGEVLWLNSYGPNGSFEKIAIQGNNLFVVGSFQGAITIGASALTSAGQTDVLIAKFDRVTGAPVWAKRFGGLADDRGSGLAVSSSGQCYLSGGTFGNITVGTTTLSLVGGLDAFLIKLDINGEPIWTKSIAGNLWENAVSVTLVESDHPVVTGYFTANTSVGSTILSAAGNEDIFVAKFSSDNGEVIWATKAGGNNSDQGLDITSDASGNIYLTGYIEYSASFGNINLPNSTSSRDIFVAKYNSGGTIQWVKKAGGNETDVGQGISVGQDGIIHVTGFYRTYPLTLESTTLQNAGGDDVFVWKIWQ